MPAASPVVLESGDHLTRAEFHRRYCARPDIHKAELVEGVVYVASPVRFDVHGEPHGVVVFWLMSYRSLHPEVRVGDNATILLDGDNEVQPDALLWHVEASGPRLNDAGYLEGAPQLVFEVAASSASYDLHEKLRVYRRNGVLEYVVWRVLDDVIDWFELEDGEYVAIQPDSAGLIESKVFSGLRLNVPAMLAGDLVALRAALDL